MLRLLLLFIFCTNVYAVDYRNYIPPRAYMYKQTLKTEIDKHYPDIPDINYPPALIEHESCVSLTNSKCWSPRAELKTKREQGVGLIQITRAFNPDGSVRFDTLWSLRNKYRNELSELSWSNVKEEPHLQIRAMILLLRDISGSFNSLARTDPNK